MKASEVMTTCVISVLPDTNAREVARILRLNRIGGVPVVDNEGRIIGMISDGDLSRHPGAGVERAWWLAHPTDGEAAADAPMLVARDLMTQAVYRATEDTLVEDIAVLLERHQIKRVPIERDGKLVGLVSRANLIHALACGGYSSPAADTTSVREAVRQALERSGASTHLVNAVVRDGTVYLWGAVDSRSQRDTLFRAAAACPGIRTVSDHLFILSDRLQAG